MVKKQRNVYFKCPYCDLKGKAIEIIYERGINDYGGFILRCKHCNKEFFLPLKNPNPDLESRILDDNFEILEIIDFEIYDKEKIDKYKFAKDVIIIENEENFPFSKNSWNIKVSYPWEEKVSEIFKCSNCNREIKIDPNMIKKVNNNINYSYKNFYNRWVKGGVTTPKFIISKENIACSNCNKNYDVCFGAKFNGRGEEITREEIILIDIKDAYIDINGIFSRYEANIILRKLIYRWNAISSKILLISPFIGYDAKFYQGNEYKFVEFTEELLSLFKDNKINIFTRESEWKKFESLLGEEFINSLEDYGIQHHIINQLKKAHNLDYFHSKVYAGIIPTKQGYRVEVLTGSFNLHPSSKTLENLNFLEMDFRTFKEKYLQILGLENIVPQNLNFSILKDNKLKEVTQKEDIYI